MNRKEKFENLKNDLLQIFKSEKMKFSSFETTDGKKITSSTEKLGKDSKVFGEDSEGNQIPLDNGDYILNDGSTITVTDGVVSGIKATDGDKETQSDKETPETDMEDATKVDKPEADKPEADKPEADKPEADKPSDDIESIKSQMVDMQTQIDQLMEVVKMLADGNKEMMSRIDVISETPVQPIPKNRQTFSQFTSTDSKTAKSNQALDEMRELMKMMKK